MKNTVICIGREYGSGGREVGEKLAGRLGVVCYDKLLLRQVAQTSGIPLKTVESEDERPLGFADLASGNVFADSVAISAAFYSEQDRVFAASRQTVLELAQRESCVIIGRCASAVLRGAGLPVLSVFLYADPEDRIDRIADRNHIGRKEAEKRMGRIDRMRRRYFDFYAGTPWGAPASYDLMLSTSRYGIDGAVDLLERALRCAAAEDGAK